MIEQPTLGGITPAPKLEAGFDDWYSSYPLKRERQCALRAWKKARRLYSVSQLTSARDAYVALKRGDGGEPVFCYPATFLNQKVPDYLHSSAEMKEIGAKSLVSGPREKLIDGKRHVWIPGSGWSRDWSAG